jgi:hypothetical protein
MSYAPLTATLGMLGLSVAGLVLESHADPFCQMAATSPRHHMATAAVRGHSSRVGC